MAVICGKCKKQVMILGKYTYCDCGKRKASGELIDYVNER